MKFLKIIFLCIILVPINIFSLEFEYPQYEELINERIKKLMMITESSFNNSTQRKKEVILEEIEINKKCLEIKDEEGNTALLKASKQGHYHVFIYLIKLGAKINATNYNGCSSFNLAYCTYFNALQKFKKGFIEYISNEQANIDYLLKEAPSKEEEQKITRSIIARHQDCIAIINCIKIIKFLEEYDSKSENCNEILDYSIYYTKKKPIPYCACNCVIS